MFFPLTLVLVSIGTLLQVSAMPAPAASASDDPLVLVFGRSANNDSIVWVEASTRGPCTGRMLANVRRGLAPRTRRAY